MNHNDYIGCCLVKPKHQFPYWPMVQKKTNY